MLQLDNASDKLDASKAKMLEGGKLPAEAVEEWRNHPVTKLLMIDLKSDQIDAIIQYLKEADPKLLGIINAVEKILEWEPEVEDE